MVRTALTFLRRHRVDLQSRLRRDAQDWAEVHRRLMADSPVRVIVDIGAHHGRLSRAYHRVFPEARVYAFEPAPASFQHLRRNLGREPWAELVQAAAGAHDGEARLFVSQRNDQMSNSAFPFADGEAAAVGVQSVRLDTFCRDRSIEHVDCLKIDVEGFELAVLEGARGLLERGAVDVIMAEARTEPICSGAATLGSLSRFMDDAGYTLFGLYSVQWRDDLMMDFFDTIWVSAARFKRYFGRDPRRSPTATSPAPSLGAAEHPDSAACRTRP
ncbi:MAG: FkbM family methyltransferase [Phycisphaerales bacterium]|nr:FkbM family methyltransferase [Phycisphaerales bacterium]